MNQLSFCTTDVAGFIPLPPGVEMAVPGDPVDLEVERMAPTAREKVLRLAAREGSRAVGAEVVANVIQ